MVALEELVVKDLNRLTKYRQTVLGFYLVQGLPLPLSGNHEFLNDYFIFRR